MKVCVIQPRYSMDWADAEACFQEMLGFMAQCDESMDIIVLPEYCDVPASAPDDQAFADSVAARNGIIARECAQLAQRCHALVFANYAYATDHGYANATHVFDRQGRELGVYMKAHPAPSEERNTAIDCSYSYSYEPPSYIDIDGLRFGFMTCYDFYMYEGFAALARANVDVIIGCSHQRTDTHSALEIIGRFLSYNTNAYLIRSAVSLGEDSDVCGCSMVVAPDGGMLMNMENRVGLGVAKIDPAVKYYKPAGFQGGMKAHWEYIDEGRRPFLYRPGGSMMLADDEHLPYPRICAHRGFNTIAPENSMPAFGAAVALGAEEIEFDIWSTKDGVLVSSHDDTLDRVSDGTGHIRDYTYDELLAFDFGVKKSEHYRGLRIIRFEDILKKFSCTTIMNIHVKIWDSDTADPMFDTISRLIHQYDAQKHCYMMSSSDKRLAGFHQVAPDIHRCVGWDGNKTDMLSMTNRALALGAQKVQLFKPYFDQSSVDYARQNGIITNVFYADDPDEARRYRAMGIDCILTNDYLSIKNALAE